MGTRWRTRRRCLHASQHSALSRRIIKIWRDIRFWAISTDNLRRKTRGGFDKKTLENTRFRLLSNRLNDKRIQHSIDFADAMNQPILPVERA
jgi:hypothetical protein